MNTQTTMSSTGAKILWQQQKLKFELDQADRDKLKSFVVAAIKSGLTDDAEIVELAGRISGAHIEARVQALIEEEQHKLWYFEKDHTLQLMERVNG
ncbi:hypothetical protein [Alteriqipengyuania sp. 357]